MPIGEFSERTGLTPKRLRSYAVKGLLSPAAVDANSGYRYYSPAQLSDARLIETLRTGDMPLTQIAAILQDRSTERLDHWAQQISSEASQRRAALELARDLMHRGFDSKTARDNETEGRNPGMELSTAARTDVGRERANNEDAVVSRDGLAAVADGMGGAPGGEVAAAVAASLIDSAFTGRSIDEMAAAARAANRSIWDRASNEPDLEGMGTTLCAVGLLESGDLAIVNVGDSRAYLWRAGSLRRLTEDHSITAEMVRRGEISEQQASGHPHRNVLTRALGVGLTVEVDITVHPGASGDRILVCSDGLFNEVSEEELATAISGIDDALLAADALVELALSNGGYDNVSAVVGDVRL